MRKRLCLSILLLSFLPLHAEAVPIEEATAEKAADTGEAVRKCWPAETPVDETALQRAGVRRIDGRHLTLHTDLPAGKQVDELPDAFDQAIPLLCDYFGLDRRRYETLRIEGFLIDDPDKFKPSGALAQVPNLKHGYALRRRIWLRNQSSEYYRRHLLLHEGVHVFMGYAFGNSGPPWYREGTAELLGTHRWENGRLTIGVFPDTPWDFARWGRIEYVRRDVDQKRLRSLEKLFELGPEDYNENEAYAWSWAFAAFCEHHPKYREPFRRTAWSLAGTSTGISNSAAELFSALLGDSFPEQSEATILRRLEFDWNDFQRNLVYAYDFKRTEIDYGQPGRTISDDGIRVRADRGWQNGGVRLEKGKTYRIKSSGRFQLADKPKIWWSEPNGVTLRYHNGLPLGTLMGALLPEVDSGDVETKTLGSEAEWTPTTDGTLFLRINDFASELDDNRGEANVKIKEKRSKGEEE